MANINVSDLQPVDRIRSEAEFLEAVSDSVARAVQARGVSLTNISTALRSPITTGIIYVPTTRNV